jgi:SSS family transporter
MPAALDLAVLAAYLGSALWVGRAAGRGRDLEGFLFGGRRMAWPLILGSIVATETSTATFLSVPGLSFREGGSLWFLQLALGYCLGRLVVARLFLPAYFAGRIESAYELLGRRFGGGTRRLAAGTFLLTRTIGDGLRLFLTAAALERFLGVSFVAALLCMSLATLAYTALGGMASIVWNDCLQGLLYLLGGVLALYWALEALPGGLAEMLDFARESGRLRLFQGGDWLGDPRHFAAGLIGGLVLTMGTHGADQMMVQRCLAAGELKSAARALIWSGPVVFLQFLLFLSLGLALAAEARVSGVDPAPDQAVAAFLARAAPAGTGLLGLFAAAIAAAAMSTLSSSLNASAGSLLSDFWRPWRGERGGELRLLRGFTLLFMALQIAVALLARGQSESVVSEVLAVAGFSAGLLLGLFLLARLAPRADARAAGAGFAAALLLLLFLRFVAPALGFSLAWPWYALVGAGTLVLVGAALARGPRVAAQP